ncbi:MAG: glycosyltransferase family 39 protein [Verrucomicrobia bacterium]|nr:glycosyltransferase family 39 protein [Verrucomicrobiota bacterium]
MKRDIWLILALTLVFGLAGGVPYFHPDGLVDEALYALDNQGSTGFFWYPGFIIYLNAAAYGLVRFVCRVCGGLKTWDAIEDMLDALPGISFNTPGHLITVAFSFLGALAAYLTVRRLTGRRGPGLFAAGLLAVSLLWVRNSHYVTPDVPLAALCLLTVYLTLVAGAGGTPFTRRHVVLLGVCLGLVGATKYNGVVVALPVGLAMLWAYRGQYPRMIRDGLLLGVVAAAVFALLNPYLFIDWKVAREQFLFLANEFSAGKLGFETSNGWRHHLTDSLYYGYGLLPLLLAALGLVWLIGRRDIRTRDKVAVLVFPAAFYLLMGHENVSFARHIVPVLPFAAVLSALGGLAIHNGLRRRVPERILPWVTAILALAVLIPGARQSSRHNALLAAGDTREDLARLLREVRDLPPVNLYAGYYGKREARKGNLDFKHFIVSSTTFKEERDPVRGVFTHPLDIIVLDSFSHDRLLFPAGGRMPEAEPGAWENLRVIQLTPYTVPKKDVPVTPESIYSPALPDMKARRRAGPFIEIYCRNEGLAAELSSAGERAGVAYRLLPGREGFYFNHAGGHINLR